MALKNRVRVTVRKHFLETIRGLAPVHIKTDSDGEVIDWALDRFIEFMMTQQSQPIPQTRRVSVPQAVSVPPARPITPAKSSDDDLELDSIIEPLPVATDMDDPD